MYCTYLNPGIPLAKENAMLERELSIVKAGVRNVGKAIIRIGEKHYAQAVREPDWSIVTKAYSEADRLLRETLLQGFSEYGWLPS